MGNGGHFNLGSPRADSAVRICTVLGTLEQEGKAAHKHFIKPATTLGIRSATPLGKFRPRVKLLPAHSGSWGIDTVAGCCGGEAGAVGHWEGGPAVCAVEGSRDKRKSSSQNEYKWRC